MIKGAIKVLIFITICIAFGFLSGFISYKVMSASMSQVDYRIDKINPDMPAIIKPVNSANDEIINFLIVGVEKNKNDVIAFAAYNTTNNKLDMFSLPRDLHYRLKGGNLNNIDKLRDVYKSVGVEGLKQAVTEILDNVPIHHHIIVDFKGFESIIDSIGGVSVTIKEAMIYEDPYQQPPLVINFKAGTHVLNGSNSLKYIRYLSGNQSGTIDRGDDIGRLKEIQSFMKSVIEKSFTYKLPTVFATAIRHVDTSLSPTDIGKLSTSVAGIKNENITFHTLPGYMTREGYFVIDQDKLQDLINNILPVDEEN